MRRSGRVRKRILSIGKDVHAVPGMSLRASEALQFRPSVPSLPALRSVLFTAMQLPLWATDVGRDASFPGGTPHSTVGTLCPHCCRASVHTLAVGNRWALSRPLNVPHTWGCARKTLRIYLKDWFDSLSPLPPPPLPVLPLPQ